MQVRLKFESYIAAPYWPELSKLIDIAKDIHPKLGEAKRKQAIAAKMQTMGITQQEYEQFQARSLVKWYKHPDGRIYIPRHQLAGCLVQTVKHSPKPIRGTFDEDSFRSLVRLTDFVTEKN
jgi:hypothetical protein